MTWTPQQQTYLTPNDGDIARAMQLTAGMAVGDTDIIDTAMTEAVDEGRTAQMMLAAAELLVRGHDLRDDEDALRQWRIGIADHRSRIDAGESE